MYMLILSKGQHEKKNNDDGNLLALNINDFYEKETFSTAGKALFILLLAIGGNFLAEMLGCQIQRVLHKMIWKQVLFFCLIYFTVDFTVFSSKEVVHPVYQIIKAFILWIAFNLFGRMDYYYAMIAFVVLLILYIIGNFRAYWSATVKPDKKEEYEKTDILLKKTQWYLFLTVVMLLVIGVINYFFKKEHQYKKGFHLFDFIVGHEKCKHGN